MSVAVLSLRVIIASIAVRSETTPVISGGVTVGLPNDHTVESRATSLSSRISLMSAEPGATYPPVATLRTELTS